MYVEIHIPLRVGHISGRWYGNRGERPILALHGWQDNAGSFALLAPLLSQHVAILAIDFPGHGISSHNPTGIVYHTLSYVGIVKQIMQYFKWQRVSLMGHSMGASISYHFAALFPHLVDVMISIDAMSTRYHSLDFQIYVLGYSLDKFIAETDRKLQPSTNAKQPPSHTFSQLENILHDASENSIDVDKTKYILERNTTETGAESGLFYFSRDGGVKYLLEYNTEPGLCLTMAKRLYGIKWLVLKAQDSNLINEGLALTKDLQEMMRRNNPNFRYHVLDGVKHHCHLNNAELVAEYILPFLQQHRPPQELAIEEVACKL